MDGDVFTREYRPKNLCAYIQMCIFSFFFLNHVVLYKLRFKHSTSNFHSYLQSSEHIVAKLIEVCILLLAIQIQVN